MAKKEMHPNSLANLLPPFSVGGRQAINPGRKPSRLKKYIKDNNLSAHDIAAASKYLLPKNEDEIKDIILDKKIPLLMRVFAKALLQDLKNGNMDNVFKMFDRAVGKPVEQIETIIKEIHIGLPPSMEDAEFPDED